MRGNRCTRRRLILAAVFALVGLALTFGGYPKAHLSLDPLTSTRILDREGRLLYEKRADRGGYGRPTPLTRLSPYLVAATLSGEDAWFRYHPGVDPTAVARAIALNIRCACFAFGGSTITQQLAKQLDPQPRNVWGKAREAVDAFRIEIGLSKDEILEQYLNRVYYGRLAYGAEAAAQRFFAKSAADLTLDEAALLAVLPRAPTLYNPDRNPEAALARRSHVLNVMARRGWVDEDAAQAAKEAPLALVPVRTERKAPHLVDYLERTVFASPNSIRPQVLHTTIDLELQTRIETRVRAHLADLQNRGVDQAGVVVLDNATGDVLAMVGSRSYSDARVHGATNVALALRPPGSTLKPFVYALAFEDGALPSSPIIDERTNFAGYQPRSSFGHHLGQVTMREALASSLNAPAVKLAHRVGVERVQTLLQDLGIEQRQSERGLSLALGGTSVRLADLANGYATLARGGEHFEWTLVQRSEAPSSRRVLSRDAALLVTQVLSDPVARRLQFGVETALDNVELNEPNTVAAKTGTSQSFGDNLTVGYTRTVTVAAWVGNFDGRPMRSLIAMKGAAPLWADVMRLALERSTPKPFDEPSRVDDQASKAWRELPEATLHVASPRDGVTLVIDPTVSRAQQQLPLRAKAPSHVENIRWEIDGRVVGNARKGDAVLWRLQPGKHSARVLALDSDGAVRAASKTVHFEVQEEI